MGILDSIAKDMQAKIDKEQSQQVTTPIAEKDTQLELVMTPEELADFANNPKPLTRQEMLDSERAFRKEIAEIELSPEYKAKQRDIEIARDLAKDPELILGEKRKGNMIQATVQLPDGSLTTVLRPKRTWKGKDTLGNKYLFRGKYYYESEIYNGLELKEQDLDKIAKFRYSEKSGLEAIIRYFHKKETKSHLGKLTVGQVQTSLYNWLHGEYY